MPASCAPLPTARMVGKTVSWMLSTMETVPGLDPIARAKGMAVMMTGIAAGILCGITGWSVRKTIAEMHTLIDDAVAPALRAKAKKARGKAISTALRAPGRSKKRAAVH